MVLLEVLPVQPLIDTLMSYKWVILFYAAVIGVIYFYRDKFDWQAKFIGLYRTKVGLKLMERLGKHEKFFKTLGYIGIVVGFAGMLFIVGMLFKGLYDLLFIPNAPPVVSPVIPGVPIPGLGIKVPLIIGWIALFLVIVVHEFSHGVVSKAHRIPVKSSGLMVFGPLGGAFVEPEEAKLRKAKPKVQLSIYAAGPFSNLLMSGLVFLLITFALYPLATTMYEEPVIFRSIQPGYPAAEAGLEPDVVYTVVNGVPVADFDDFYTAVEDVEPGDSVLFEAPDKEPVLVTATEYPDDPSRGYFGVIPGVLVKPGMDWPLKVLLWFVNLLMWTFVLSLGIGLANLLPMGPVDGGRMLQTICERYFGVESGRKVWARISIFMIALLIVLLVIPFVIKPFVGLF